MSMMAAQEPDRQHDSGAAATEEPRHAVRSPRTSHRAASYDRGVQIAAAQLRMVTDRRLGKATPEWIRALAQEEPRAS
ncbi:hypothetical protein B1A87_002985 [Arthrobacter sp. KBS0703]|nr:hypothetical protein B1A87_002985 [Arthrobacter sp. KBS0703]